jgi:signal transduction protein with GAF and PtsI domain
MGVNVMAGTVTPGPIPLRLALSGEEPPGPRINQPFDAVGMIRSEYVLRMPEEFVTLEGARRRIADYVARVAETFFPRPVWYRTTELTTQEANTLRGVDAIVEEADFMKGLRGLRRGLIFPDTFLLEVSAVAEVAASWRNVHLLLPYVGGADEFARGVDLVERAGWPNRFGSMVEIPAAVLDAERLVRLGATNLMVGLNDLTSLMTGAARAGPYDDKLHPSVWWCVERVKASVDAAACEWGIAGNLAPGVLARAADAGVPYATVHYADLPALLGVDRHLLPDVDFVHRTKIKTRSQIAAFDLRRTMSRLGLEAAW